MSNLTTPKQMSTGTDRYNHQWLAKASNATADDFVATARSSCKAAPTNTQKQ